MEENTTNTEGQFTAVQDKEGITFTKNPEAAPTGQAYVETDRAKVRRDQELEAGRKRVAIVAEQQKNRPPRIIPDKEKQAQGSNVPVFRPNSVLADRVTNSNGLPVNQALGALMRKVGGNKPNG